MVEIQISLFISQPKTTKMTKRKIEAQIGSQKENLFNEK